MNSECTLVYLFILFWRIKALEQRSAFTIRLGLHTGAVLNGEVGRELASDDVGKGGGS